MKVLFFLLYHYFAHLHLNSEKIEKIINIFQFWGFWTAPKSNLTPPPHRL